MSERAEVERAAAIVTGAGRDLVLLHCNYPLADGRWDLRRMSTLRDLAGSVGLSDHSAGYDLRSSLLAIALGADWIERHFVLSRPSAARDAPVSIDPEGLARLVAATRDPEPHLALAERHPEILGEADRPLSEPVRRLREFYVGRWGDNR